MTFDSPILHCDVCRRIVLRDTRWQDCARAHHCHVDECPYKDYFVGVESGAGPDSVKQPDNADPAD